MENPKTGTWHQADVLTVDGWVIELQHSSISQSDMAERESFYGENSAGMVWLMDAELRRTVAGRMLTRDRRVLVAGAPAFVHTTTGSPFESEPVVRGVLPGVTEQAPCSIWGEWSRQEFVDIVTTRGVGVLLDAYRAARDALVEARAIERERKVANDAAAAARSVRLRAEWEAAKERAADELRAVRAAHAELTRDGFTGGVEEVCDIDVAEFREAVKLLQARRPTKRVSSEVVTNGNVIAAALHLNLRVERAAEAGACINLSGPSLRKIGRDIAKVRRSQHLNQVFAKQRAARASPSDEVACSRASMSRCSESTTQ